MPKKLSPEELNKLLAVPTRAREIAVDSATIDAEKRTMSVAFSSEFPVDRGYYYEVLSHEPGAVLDDYVDADGEIPFIVQHTPSLMAGQVGTLGYKGAVGRGTVRFATSDFAQGIYQEHVDKVRKMISFGYRVFDAEEITKDDVPEKFRDQIKGEPMPIYRITRWAPMEVSSVAVPADLSVGVGREAVVVPPAPVAVAAPVITSRRDNVKTPEELAQEAREAAAIETAKREGGVEAVKKFQQNVKEIRATAEKFKDNAKLKAVVEPLVERFIAEQRGADEFKIAVFEAIKPEALRVDTSAEIGLSAKDIKRYSFVKAIRAMAEIKEKPKVWENSFEREVHEATMERMRMESPRGLLIPMDVMRHQLEITKGAVELLQKTRELQAGSGPLGGYTVATDLLAADFIELLRNRMIMNKVGVRVLSGLVGDIAIPKQTGGATTYWVNETGEVTGSDQALGQVGMTPHILGALTSYSKKLLAQSSIDVEGFVRMDLAIQMAIELDRAILNGTGADEQPLGVMNQNGVAVVSLDTNGGAPTWNSIVDLETSLAAGNADVGNMAYITNARGRGKMKKTTKVASSTFPIYLWENTQVPGEGMLNGYRALVSNQVPGNLSKGSGTNLSALLFGNWGDVIVGQWGALDMVVDPYTLAANHAVRVVNHLMCDVAIRHSASFAMVKDMVTTD